MNKVIFKVRGKRIKKNKDAFIVQVLEKPCSDCGNLTVVPYDWPDGKPCYCKDCYVERVRKILEDEQTELAQESDNLNPPVSKEKGGEEDAGDSELIAF